MILIITSLSYCSKEEEEPIPEDKTYVLGQTFFLTTDRVNYITCVTARTGGQIIENEGCGGSGVYTDAGVCWNTTPNPTTADYRTTSFGVEVIGTDQKHFHSTLTSLKSGTTYYVRSFATNSEGTIYGNELSFTTPDLAYASVSDLDGNIYRTIQIDTQTWMAENLKTTRYNDGSPICTGTGDPDKYWSAYWFGSEEGAYCWYDFDTKNKDTYGAIYNWHAAKADKLCPTGWHVPTYSEWTSLITSMGGGVTETNETAYFWLLEERIKESGFNPASGAGLHGLAGFWSSDNGSWWWTATQNQARIVSLTFMGGLESTFEGYNVRCLKN